MDIIEHNISRFVLNNLSDIQDIPIQEQIDNSNAEFLEYILNSLKQLKSKLKTLIIVVDNSSNYR